MQSALTHKPRLALVGVDDKEPADFAVVAAFRNAPALRLEVELVHALAVPLNYYAHVDPLGVERAQKAAAERWTGVLRDAGIIGAELARSLRTVPGRAADVLVERARDLDAGLIVLGRHQKRGPFEFGDVVREVIVRAPCPVWVQAGPAQPVRRVLCPVDLGSSSRAVLELARDIAKASGASLCVLHSFVRPELGYVLGYPLQFPASFVDEARDSAEREFDALLGTFDFGSVPHSRRFSEGSPAADILAAQDEFDLVVMGTHGRSALASAFMGSVAGDVLRDARIPVLVRRNL